MVKVCGAQGDGRAVSVLQLDKQYAGRDTVRVHVRPILLTPQTPYSSAHFSSGGFEVPEGFPSLLAPSIVQSLKVDEFLFVMFLERYQVNVMLRRLLLKKVVLWNPSRPLVVLMLYPLSRSQPRASWSSLRGLPITRLHLYVDPIDVDLQQCVLPYEGFFSNIYPVAAPRGLLLLPIPSLVVVFASDFETRQYVVLRHGNVSVLLSSVTWPMMGLL